MTSKASDACGNDIKLRALDDSNLEPGWYSLKER